MAPAPGAQAEGPGLPAHVPGDHQGGHRARLRPAARHRPGPCGRPGDPAHPGPPLRLRDLARTVAQGLLRALRGTRAVRGYATRGPARAGADRVRPRRLLGPHGPVRPPGGPGRRAPVQRAPELPQRSPRGHWQGLQRPRRAEVLRRGRAGRARRDGGDGARGRVAGRRLRGPLPGDQALHPPPGGPVHHLDTATGGGPQAAVHLPHHHARGAAAVRERLHHLHANGLGGAVRPGRQRGSGAGQGALRGRVRARLQARVRLQVQERPGGPRGRAPRRGPLPHAVAGALSAVRGRVQALRADLEAHCGLADGGRQGQHCHRAPGCRGHRRRGRPRRGRRRVLGLRNRHHLPRVPGRVRGRPGCEPGARAGLREEVAEGRGQAPARDVRGGRAGRLRGHRGRAHDHPSGALHRGVPGEDAGRARHRAPVHVRRHDLHDHGPRLRAGARLGADPVLARVLRGASARGPLLGLRGLRLHGGARGRPGPDRPRRGRAREVALWLLLRGEPVRARAQAHRGRPRGDRRPRGELHPHYGRDHPARGQVRPLPGGRRHRGPGDGRDQRPRAGERPPGPRPGRAHTAEGAGAHGDRQGGRPRAGGEPGERSDDRGQGRPLRTVRHRDRARAHPGGARRDPHGVLQERQAQAQEDREAQAQHGVAVLVHEPSGHHARRRPEAAVPAA